jgi:hypothetical protein
MNCDRNTATGAVYPAVLTFRNLNLQPLHLYRLFNPKDVKLGMKPFRSLKSMKTNDSISRWRSFATKLFSQVARKPKQYSFHTLHRQSDVGEK